MVFENIKSLLLTGIVGVVLILSASSNFFTEFDYGNTEAQITNVQYDDPNYKLSVVYSIDGTIYNGMLSIKSPHNKAGDVITINYEKKNYNKITPYTNKAKMAIYSSIGAIICLTLFYFAFFQVQKELRQAEKLFED
jgi:hypothetical protein